MDEPDFLEIVHNALWELAISRPEMAVLVKEGNRVNFLSETDRSTDLKDTYQTADLPLLILEPTNITGNLHNTSSSSMLQVTYQFMINTGDLRVKELYPILTALIRGLVDWRTTIGGLTWKGETFIKKCDFVGGLTGRSNPAGNAGIRGWVTLWACRVEMHLSNELLRAV